MGVKQSKRSVDITETSTKGEIEGFGNEGKVEKIIDGVVEKVAANGHVEDLVNGIEPLQNGMEPIQNGEAAAVVTEKVAESKDVDESALEGVINGQVEHGEAGKTEEAKKSDEKKEKKKEKKEKVIKKKFSFRNFSFSKKDKSKPPKEEKPSEKVDETGAEEAMMSPEKEEISSPSQAQSVEVSKPGEALKLEVNASIPAGTNTIAEKVEQEAEAPAAEKTADVNSKIPAGFEDLPPPLPASPPPSEPIEGKLISGIDKLDISEASSVNSSEKVSEVSSSISNVLSEKNETSSEIIKSTEQIAIETGKQIEEKATNLLKTVEERAEESMRTAGEFISQKANEMQEIYQNELGIDMEKTEAKAEAVVDEARKLEGVPVEMSSIGSLSPKAEEPTDKPEEGAGESLADIPKDLTDAVAVASPEPSNFDSLEVPAATPPPLVVEAVTGE